MSIGPSRDPLPDAGLVLAPQAPTTLRSLVRCLMGWQGKPEPTRGVSARIVAQSALNRAVRSWCVDPSVRNQEAVRSALEVLDSIDG